MPWRVDMLELRHTAVCRRASSTAVLVLFCVVHMIVRCNGALEGNSISSTGVAPYDLDGIRDLQTLLWWHQRHQTMVLLSNSTSKPPAVLVTPNDLVGLGNRVPAMITGFVMALFTGRLYLLHSSFLNLMDTPFPAAWPDYMQRYAGATKCSTNWTKLAGPGVNFCANGQPASEVDLILYASIDYELPLLQLNPALESYFKKFFPDGEVFHAVSRYLFRPKSTVEEAMKPYLPLADQCLVGMHIRTRKYGGIRIKQFIAIARMLTQAKEGSVFVASDANLFSFVQQHMPGHTVWWSNITQAALQKGVKTKGRNPGTELSAVVDVMLLSKCRALILTPASSMGAIAAGFGGIRPVFANFGRHEDPFLNPWFWKSMTMEPCMFKAANMHLANDTISMRFRDTHPLYLHNNQCHYQQHLRRAPPYLKMSTSNTSYLTPLMS